MPTVDLHTHSTFSDGTCSPEEVVHSALKRGVQLLSLTDHDTTDGTLLAQQVAQAHGLRFVPGVEISTCEHDHLHFTGYGVDITNPVFQQFLASNRTARQGRIKQVIKQLQTAGIAISEEDVFSRAPNTVSRAHVADVLQAKGYAHSRHAAFRQYLLEGQPGYVPAIGVTAAEAIRQIKQAGGKAVLAHPGIVSEHWDFPAWVEAGLEGVEVYYPAHSFAMRQELVRLADKYGLFITAGSDYHGPTGGKTTMPGMPLPQNYFDRLLSKLG